LLKPINCTVTDDLGFVAGPLPLVLLILLVSLVPDPTSKLSNTLNLQWGRWDLNPHDLYGQRIFILLQLSLLP